MDEYDVAVVVFCRSQGADAADAEDRAKLAVRYSLAEQNLRSPVPLTIYVPSHLGGEPVQVAAVQGMRYTGGQGVRLTPTAEPYQNAGMGKPRKAK